MIAGNGASYKVIIGVPGWLNWLSANSWLQLVMLIWQLQPQWVQPEHVRVGHDLIVCAFKPHIGLCAAPVWVSLSLSLPLPHLHVHTHTHYLSKINKLKKKNTKVIIKCSNSDNEFQKRTKIFLEKDLQRVLDGAKWDLWNPDQGPTPECFIRKTGCILGCWLVAKAAQLPVKITRSWAFSEDPHGPDSAMLELRSYFLP